MANSPEQAWGDPQQIRAELRRVQSLLETHRAAVAALAGRGGKDTALWLDVTFAEDDLKVGAVRRAGDYAGLLQAHLELLEKHGALLNSEERATALVEDLRQYLTMQRIARTAPEHLTEEERHIPYGTEHSRRVLWESLRARILRLRTDEQVRERVALRMKALGDALKEPV